LSDLSPYAILVREHEAMVFSYLLSIVRDRHIAEDIAQETFLMAYKKLSTLKKTESFAAWVRSIARNTAINEMRRRQREVPTDPGVLQGIEDLFAALDDKALADTWAERTAAVQKCFEKLPEAMRRVCELHYMEGKPTKNVANMLTVSLSAVHKRLERARRAVRRCVEKRLELEGV